MAKNLNLLHVRGSLKIAILCKTYVHRCMKPVVGISHFKFHYRFVLMVFN